MSEFASVRQSVNELLEAVHQLDRVSDGIQKCVMDTRMVPIGPLFTRFKRVIRDISRGKGKEIRLAIHGEKTELDKRMIDELGDPLIHIVRNSADHGIESPDDRVAAGKPREGTVTLDASHRGNSIVIQIRDDGKGLDSNKIRAKAVQKGMMTAADADKLTDQQAYQLIWEPGLSTAEKITEVSGRGMGMDIVRSKIEQINGMVELDSAPGQGTTITIKLPLTLAILPSLLAEIDGDVFAIPVETVSEIVCVSTQDMSHVHGLDTATVRGRVISVVHLPQIFEWNDGRRQATTGKNGDDKTLVIVGDDGREVGLVVHRLLGEEDVVIKSLAENFRNVEGIAGASILGDGRVSLILDVGALVERSSQSTKQNCLV
jgi:two-component system chemotaxis sensor kinase CheA